MHRNRDSKGKFIITPSPYSREELDELYWGQGLGLREIASRLNTTYLVVRNSFVKLDIPMRGKLEGLRLLWRKKGGSLPYSRDELHGLYWGQGLCLREIASRLNTTYLVVRNSFVKLDIPRRPISEAVKVRRRHNVSQVYHRPHYWLIDCHNIGRCKYCGAVKDFGRLQERAVSSVG